MKVGDKFSVKFNLSEQIYIRFLENFRDNNILHVNDSYAVKDLSLKLFMEIY